MKSDCSSLPSVGETDFFKPSDEKIREEGSNSLETRIHSRLSQHQTSGLMRIRKARETAKGLISFSSNDYLGLMTEPLLLKAFEEGAARYGFGTGGSPLVSGHSEVHRRCEGAFAEYLNREKALLFANGYLANIGVIPALFEANSTLFFDKYNHASLYDGAKLSEAKLERYPHLDLTYLEQLLVKAAPSTLPSSDREEVMQAFPCDRSPPAIVTENIFSTDGSQADIPNLIRLSKQYGAALMVDDAHGFGVMEFPYSQTEVPILMCPLGKALGGFGAIVAGSEILIEAIMQFSRSYMFSTAPPPAIAHALTEGLALMKKSVWRKEKLFENIEFFKCQASQLGLVFSSSNHPIQSLILGNPARAIALKKRLLESGFDVTIMRPPTVPYAKTLLRISLSTQHSQTQILGFFQSLSRCLEEESL